MKVKFIYTIVPLSDSRSQKCGKINTNKNAISGKSVKYILKGKAKRKCVNKQIDS